jgi:AcrR family transcriptional regulator
MTRRTYTQGRRAESAAETRRRIVEAVYERLREAPAQPVSIDDVARIAGVARSTIYLIFGSRAGLFDAVGRDLFERGGYAQLIEAVRNPDPRVTLREGIRAGIEIFDHDRDVLRALHSMAQLDEEAVGGAIRRMEENRAAGMTTLARRLAEQKALRDDVSVSEAAHILWVITSFETADLLRTGRSLPSKKTVQMLVTMAERALLR